MILTATFAIFQIEKNKYFLLFAFTVRIRKCSCKEFIVVIQCLFVTDTYVVKQSHINIRLKNADKSISNSVYTLMEIIVIPGNPGSDSVQEVCSNFYLTCCSVTKIVITNLRSSIRGL